MNCDEFVELVIEDAACGADAEEHLQSCSRCRSMQEVLSPLSHYSTSPAGGMKMVDLKGIPQSESVRVAETAAAMLSQQGGATVNNGPVLTAGSRHGTPWRFALAFLAGVATCLAGISVVQSGSVLFERAPAVCLWNAEERLSDSGEEIVKACVACHFVAKN